LKDIGEQTTSLKNTIKALDVTINKNSLDIKLAQNNIDSTQFQIKELSLNIDKNVNTINSNTEAIFVLINQVNVYDNSSFIKNFLTYKNLSEFWNEQQNVFLVQNKIKEKIDETKKIKIVLENNKIKTEKKKKDLLNLKSDLVDRKKLLDITKIDKNKILADTKNSETNYKKLLADKQALADAFDKELLQFESELKLVIDESSIPSVGKGILSWPLDVIRITQKFGMTEFAKTTNAYNGKGHKGVDFGASIGTLVKATLSGIVKGTGDTDTVCPRASFGKWVFIEHNNGLSTIYGHLSLIKVSVGQIVTTGDVIGYSGNTGYSTGPHLHLGVYATQGVKIMSRKSTVSGCGTYTMPIADLRAYLDPLQYL
ncbi:MAG: hypothetical protein C0412_18635, partial [Flavobacterium sp.]|nr:hypothetical protein [Flavobacterium sp.]